MKKILAVIMLSLLLCSCNAEIPSENTEPPDDTEIKAEITETGISAAMAVEKLLPPDVEFTEPREMLSLVPGTETKILVYSEWNGFISMNEYCMERVKVFAETESGNIFEIGEIHKFDDQDPRVGLTHILGDYYCFATDETMEFFDFRNGTKLDFILDFQKPAARWAFCSVAYDAEKEEYALIYAITGAGAEKPYHISWDDESAAICFQRFDKEGNFIDDTVTEIPLNFLNRVSCCAPNGYSEGKIQFFREGTYKDDTSWYCYDFETGELVSEKAQNGWIIGGTAILQFWERGSECALYCLFEDGKKVSEIVLELEKDFSNNPENYLYKFPWEEDSDPENKTLKVRYGYAVHEIDFSSGTVKAYYDYSVLTEENIIAKTADGKYLVYDIGAAGRGGEYMTFASKNTENGEFTFLGEHLVWNYSREIPENDFFIRTYGEICKIDVVTGEKEEFDIYGYLEEDMTFLEYALDTENKILIIAKSGDVDPFEDYVDYSKVPPICFDIFDFDFNYIRSVETNYIPAVSGKAYGPYMNGITPENGWLFFSDYSGTVENGIYTPIYPSESVKIKYLE